jgi:hypothetical protein
MKLRSILVTIALLVLTGFAAAPAHAGSCIRSEPPPQHSLIALPAA